jgi:hypothetical protein
MRNARSFFPLFTILLIFSLLILPLNSTGFTSNLIEKDTLHISINKDIELMNKEFPDSLHWSNTPVTRDPGGVKSRETSPLSGSGGTIDYLFSSNEPLARPYAHYRTARADPPLVDLYIEENLYLLPMVDETISQYVYDKTITGDYRIDVYSVSSVSAGDFREQLHQSYINGTTGAVLVGDLPEVIFEMDNSFGGYESFPCDLYFMDVNGEWADNDTNGKLDYHGGNLEADIWISRIKPSMIPAIPESTLTLDYFGKVHSYFMGDLRVNHTALLYIDDDWAAWGNLYAWNISALYPDPVLVNNNPDTNGADYIDNRVTAGYEFIQVHVHSSSTVHYFAQGGNVQASQVKNAPPQSLFMNLFCCSGSDYDAMSNFGAMYMFSGKGLATIGSTKTGSMLNFGDFYTPLANERSMGEAFLDWSKTTMERSREWHYGMSLQGDGLLSPKYDSIMYPPDFTDKNNGTIRVNRSSSDNVLIDIDITTQKGSVLDTGEYRINNGPWIGLFSEDCLTFTNNWNISKNALIEGNNTIVLRAETIFGVELNYNLTILKDTLVPANVVLMVEDGTGYVNEQDVILRVEGWDVSGLDLMSISGDGINWSAWEKYNPSKSYRLDDRDGVHDIHARISDAFFNIKNVLTQVELDRVPPMGCNISINGGAPYTPSRNVTVGISSMEEISNLTLMSVSMIDYLKPDWVPFTEESIFELDSEEGIYPIFVKVRDRANNTSPVLSSTIIYDPTPPLPLSIVANNGNILTNDTTVHLELKAHDNTSGLDKMRFGFDGLEWNSWVNFSKYRDLIIPAADGEIILYFQVMDGAGNIYNRTDVYTTLVLDKTAPVSDVVPSYPPDGSKEWYVSIPDIEIEHTGIAAYCRWNDMEDFIPYEATMTPKEGESTLYFYSVDLAGNREKVNKKVFKLDTKSPFYDVREICSEKKNPQGWYRDAVTLEFSSGITPINREMIRLEMPALVDITDTRFTIDVDGINFVQYWAEDEAGNIGRKSNIIIMIDREAPRLSASQKILGKTLVLDITASDNVGDVFFEIDPGDGTELIETEELHWEHRYKEGNYQLVIVCSDESGLTSKKIFNFTVEREMLENFYKEGEVTVAGYLAMGGLVFILILLFLLIRRKRKVPKDSIAKKSQTPMVTMKLASETPGKERVTAKYRKKVASDEWKGWVAPNTIADEDGDDAPEKVDQKIDEGVDELSDWSGENFWEWDEGDPEETEAEIGWLDEEENPDDSGEYFEIWDQ